MNTRGRDFGTPRRSSWRWGNVHVMEEWSERSQPEYLQRLRKVPTEEMRQFWNFLAVTAKHMILYYLQLTQPLFLPFKLSSEKAMAPHSRTLVWKIPWMEEPGRLQSMRSLRVGHDWATSLSRIGGGNGNPFQCSCLENPRDRGAWWATVHGVVKSWTWLSD